jgi:hypothetical protein
VVYFTHRRYLGGPLVAYTFMCCEYRHHDFHFHHPGASLILTVEQNTFQIPAPQVAPGQ